MLEQIKSLKSELNKQHANTVGTQVEKSVPLEKLNNFVAQTRDQVYSYFLGYSLLSQKFKEDKEWIKANKDFNWVKWTERTEQWKQDEIGRMRD